MSNIEYSMSNDEGSVAVAATAKPFDALRLLRAGEPA
jgi:hypothetical protein